MDLQEAVVEAKTHVIDLFGDEGIDEVGLEEVEYDDAKVWKVTIGFRRPWGRQPRTEGGLSALVLQSYRERWYKVVQIADSDGRLISVKDRILRDAA